MKFKLTWVCISNQGMNDGAKIGDFLTTSLYPEDKWPVWNDSHKGPWWAVVKVEHVL